jgi:hypothetical protein
MMEDVIARGEMTNAHKILVKKPQEKRVLGILTRRFQDNIKMNVREM